MTTSNSLVAYLLEHKLLSHEQADKATALSNQWKTPLPRTLLAMGILDSLTLYQALAKSLNTPFINLKHQHCDDSLFNYQLRADYHRLHTIPVYKKEGITTLVCTQPTDDITQWANKHYGDDWQLAITSPYDIDEALSKAFIKEDDVVARDSLWRRQPDASAKELMVGLKWRDWWLVILLCSFGVYASPAYSLFVIFGFANLFYISTLAVKLGLFAIGASAFKKRRELQGITALSPQDLPIYTLLVPLYKENAVLKKLTDALFAIDYPKAKLDIKLIVEEDDTVTIDAIKALKCRRIFEIIRVPFSLPRTKPKACNYALQFARGEYVTIYDAEDVPDSQQLKKALWTFEQASDDTVCVQARLNYFNRKENWLTRLFSLEYAGLFNFLLWGVEKLNIPIPLGGTSNHFKMHALKTLYAWDPYNVTEDADLGIRVAKHGWKVTVMDSLTLEEAPVSLNAWIKQRSRWIKGHMQTYLVHMRKPITLWRKLGTVGFFGFQFFLGAPCLIFLISPILWVLWLIGLAGLMPEGNSFFPPSMEWVIPFSITIFFGGLALQMLFAIWVVIERKWWDMWPSVLLFPFYWLLHSVASFRALWQLFKRPHYWEKTTHGVTKIELCN